VTSIYLISGQGADERLFRDFTFPPNYAAKCLDFVLPDPKSSMQDYAKKLTEQINPCNDIVLIGVSIGGMLASEIAELIECKRVIVISSAKTRLELPRKYRIFKNFQLQKPIPPSFLKRSAKIAQPIVEPDSNKEKELFDTMLNDKDPLFLKRTIDMIVKWDRLKPIDNIIHIHGDADNTIPLKHVKADYVIKGGSHMMALTKGREISDLINETLTNSTPHPSQL
jgi:pimeloyl-ACP methyl ester carboxylesterase